MNYIEVSGIKAKYIDEGKGEVILLVHGWGCNGEVYRNIIDYLSPFFRVIVPDLPGFGETDEPCVPFAVDDYAEFVLEFAKALNINTAILFGHSLGGRIIIKIFANGCPFDVPKVILTGSAGIKPKASLKAKLRVKTYKAVKCVLSAGPLKGLFASVLESFRNKFGSADYRAASPVMRTTLVKIVNEDLTPLLRHVTPPTLLIWGESDDAAPLADGRLMEKLMPNAGLALIKNAGHYAFLEQFGVFSRILSSYLNI